MTSRLPLNRGNTRRGLDIKGRPSSGYEDAAPDYLVVTPDYFKALGIPLIRGRAFDGRDTPASAPVVIINEAAARRFWPKQDPLTSSVTIGACGKENQWCQVIGIVGDIRQHNLAQPPVPAVYVPYAQDPWPFMAVVIRTQMDPMSAAPGIEAALHSVDKEQPLFHIRAMRDVISDSLSARRFRMVLLAMFAGLALLLGCVGIYGVMAYGVAQRYAEIGIRMSLGAEPRNVLLLVIGSGLKRALAGVVIGAVCSIWTTKLLASSLYGVQAADAVTLAGTFLVLIGVALCATYIPPRRATLIDPVRALRSE